mmetsp:Transcript_104957/g.301780  ORF Transcript_104957/g.301780 Transcript_104957/m.301780 type:complete len:223 (-) Transcript_104957:808-1476(-)
MGQQEDLDGHRARAWADADHGEVQHQGSSGQCAGRRREALRMLDVPELGVLPAKQSGHPPHIWSRGHPGELGSILRVLGGRRTQRHGLRRAAVVGVGGLLLGGVDTTGQCQRRRAGDDLGEHAPADARLGRAPLQRQLRQTVQQVGLDRASLCELLCGHPHRQAHEDDAGARSLRAPFLEHTHRRRALRLHHRGVLDARGVSALGAVERGADSSHRRQKLQL